MLIITLYTDARNVEPNDDEFIAPTKAIMIGTTGKIAVVTSKGTKLTLPTIAVGEPLTLSVTKVLETGTTATGIVALY